MVYGKLKRNLYAHTNIILDSSNIFSYAAKIRENVDKRFSVENLKTSYDQLRLLQHNYDKILWVSVHSFFRNTRSWQGSFYIAQIRK